MVSEIVRKKYGSIEYGYGLSVADENYFSTRAGLPSVVLGPAGGNDHAANEWVSLKSIDELSEIIKELLNSIQSKGKILPL